MCFPYMTDDRFVKIVSRHFDRGGNDHATERDHRDIRGSSSDIDNHVAEWLRDIDTRTDGCCNRFFNDVNLSRSRLICGFFHRLALYFCHAAWHADTDARLAKSLSPHGFLYKMLQHLFCNRIIRDYSLPQRTDRHNVARCSSDHLTGFLPDGFHLVCIFIIRYYGRLF